MLLSGFAHVLYVASGIFAIWAIAIIFFPAKAMPLLVASILAIAAALFFTAYKAQQAGRIEEWMRWVPSLVVTPVFALSVFENNTYALTTITVVLAIHALFLPKSAGRWLMMLTLLIGLLPFASEDAIDVKLWVRLMLAAFLGLALLDFAGRRILWMTKWLEESQVKLTKQNHELIVAKAALEDHKEFLEDVVQRRTSELESSNASLTQTKSDLEKINLKLEQLVSARTEELRNVNRELSEAVLQLERLADTDGLTGLYCRRRFLELATSEVLRAIRYGSRLSLIMLDVDHFKLINDQYGHHAGDVALTALAAFLNGSKRANDIVGRLGGEEFGILLPETSLSEAAIVGERIRSGIEALRLSDSGKSFGMTVSLGVVHLQNDSLDELLNRADELMYQAKARGRNRLVSDSPDAR